MNNTKTMNTTLKTVLIFVTVILCVSAAYIGGIYVYQSVQPKKVPSVTAQQTSSVTANAPDAAAEATDEAVVPTNTIDSYTVAPDKPRFLKINALGMKARIQQMGINSQGAVQAPVSIYDSGWYRGSALPGTQGAAFIDGHASGSTRQGLFAYIDTLENGDTVSVERGDGTVLNYKVVNVEVAPKDGIDMNKALSTYGGVKEGLNLMTCTGKWIANEKTYDKRVIVYTERIS